MGAGPLQLDDDELSSCVSCGLCLPHCPTFRVTGEEALSPRGRIAAMRAVERDGAPISSEFVEYMTTCVQCRGCEPACPSGVPYGRLMEGTRAALAERHRVTPRWQRLGYRLLPRHGVVLAASTLLALGQRLRLVPHRTGVPRLSLRRPSPVRPTAPESAADVWLFLGCVMDAWMRPTHHATASMLGRLGVTFAVPGPGGSCCGALHVHAGLRAQARRLAERVMASMPGTAPIVVNSAGCGAQLKDLGHLLGTSEAADFSERVVDVHEWMAARMDQLPPPRRHLGPIVVQDPCHLRHVQRAEQPVRTLLSLVGDVVELDDDGLCCGAGGAYAVLEPALARHIRDRKVDTIGRALRRSGAAVVASANPGCAAHLAEAGLTVMHPIDLLEEAYR
jgi:glycolate oxidase iron-sulfur subunit